MAANKRASHALVFMRRCRESRASCVPTIATRLSSSNVGQFAPSNFNKPHRPSPSQTPSSTPSPAPETQSVWDRPLQARAPWHHRPARPVHLPPPYVKATAWTWLRSVFGYQVNTPLKEPMAFRAHNNPYRARKHWPPDFTTLHPKQQLHFEKTYRRRAKLKWARPQWHKWTKLVQNTLLLTTFLYFVFILEPAHGEGTPFDGFRAWFFGKLKRLAGLSDESAEEVSKLEEEARIAGKERKGWWEWLKERYPG